jgi:hypothetical protein
VKDGGTTAAVEKGAAVIDPEKGDAVVVEEGGRALASSRLTSSLPAYLCYCR